MNANNDHKYSAASFIRCFHCLYLTAYRETQPSLSVGVAIPECLRLGDLGTSEGYLETHKRKSLVPASFTACGNMEKARDKGTVGT